MERIYFDKCQESNTGALNPKPCAHHETSHHVGSWRTLARAALCDDALIDFTHFKLGVITLDIVWKGCAGKNEVDATKDTIKLAIQTGRLVSVLAAHLRTLQSAGSGEDGDLSHDSGYIDDAGWTLQFLGGFDVVHDLLSIKRTWALRASIVRLNLTNFPCSISLAFRQLYTTPLPKT